MVNLPVGRQVNLYMSNVSDFIKLIKHPFKFKLYMLLKLPSAFFCGVSVVDINENNCSVQVPFKWFSQNPFKSTYFACLSMAAEMSTGLLCLMHIHKKNPAISMLVVKVEGSFFKKATGNTLFTCTDGNQIRQAINDALNNKEGKTITSKSLGKNPDGELVASFEITWSFKVKSNMN